MTTVSTTDSIEVDLALCARVLGVHPDAHPLQVLRAAREQSMSFSTLVLSLLERSGVSLDGAGDELCRVRTRKARYAGTVEPMVMIAAGRVVKGASLAELYPAGTERWVGDVDFVVPDEPALWRAARVVLDRHPVETVDISLFGQPEPSLLIALEWPGDDLLPDYPSIVDICTTVFAGDTGPVPVRTQLPDSRALADLLALAEERFQRPFNVKDFLDIAVLGAAPRVSPAEVVAAARQWTLAPELTELFERAAELSVLGTLAPALSGLRAATEEELARRAAWMPPVIPANTDRITAALAAGKPVGGLLLRRVEWRTELPGVQVHHYPGGALLITPIGDFMLTDDPQVEQDDHTAALAELAKLDAEGTRS